MKPEPNAQLATSTSEFNSKPVSWRDTRKSEREQKRLAGDARLTRAWRVWHRRRHAPRRYGPAECSARELITSIEAVNWSAIDADTRLVALHEINVAIMRLRERSGQEPIDDALPGQPLRAFQLIREIINPVPRNRGNAEPGGLPGQTVNSEAVS
jgi:hypothetical protein